MSVAAFERKQIYSCCPEPYADLFFTIRLRRKPLYYAFSLLVPCFGLSLISVFVFLLPTNSKEKVSSHWRVSSGKSPMDDHHLRLMIGDK